MRLKFIYYKDRISSSKKIPLISSKSILFFLLIGILGGIAFSIKQTAGIILAVIFVFEIYEIIKKERKFVSFIIDMFFMGIGLVIPILLFIIYFYNIGILDDFIKWSFKYTTGHYIKDAYLFNSIINLKNFAILIAIFFGFLIYWIFFYLGIKSHKSIKITDANNDFELYKRKQFFKFCIIWFILSWIPVSIGFRFYGHYFIFFFQSLVLISSFGVEYFLTHKLNTKKIRIIIALLIILPTAFYTYLSTDYRTGMIVIGDRLADYEPATDYIRNNTKETDQIFVWGWFTPLYVVGERSPGTRFVYCSPLSGDIPGGSKSREEAVVEGAWDYLMKDLNDNMPELIIDTSPGKHYTGYQRYPLKNYKLLYDFVQKNYNFEKEVGGIHIYRKK